MNKLGTVDSININTDTNISEEIENDLPVVINHSEIGQAKSTREKTSNYDFQTELIELPSKGLLYSKDNPLSSGTVEIKYMTAKEEDILSTQSYIKQGVVLDKLCSALIVTPGVKYDDLLIGDKNAILFAARSLGYGPNYQTSVEAEDGTEIPITINLDEVPHKQLDESLITPYENKFKFILPKSNKTIEFKLLTVKDQREIDSTIKSFQKLGPNYTQANLTTRLRKMILSVDGSTQPEVISKFIDNMLAIDSRAFREYIANIQPDIDLGVDVEDPNTGEFFRSNFTIGVDLFYPDYKR